MDAPCGTDNSGTSSSSTCCVKIPSFYDDAGDKGGGVIKYNLVVSGETENTHNIERRYKDFEELHHKMRSAYIGGGYNNDMQLPELPGKKLFKNHDPDFIASRKKGLETYINALIQIELEAKKAIRTTALRDFLEISKLQVQPRLSNAQQSQWWAELSAEERAQHRALADEKIRQQEEEEAERARQIEEARRQKEEEEARRLAEIKAQEEERKRLEEERREAKRLAAEEAKRKAAEEAEAKRKAEELAKKEAEEEAVRAAALSKKRPVPKKILPASAAWMYADGCDVSMITTETAMKFSEPMPIAKCIAELRSDAAVDAPVAIRVPADSAFLREMESGEEASDFLSCYVDELRQSKHQHGVWVLNVQKGQVAFRDKAPRGDDKGKTAHLELLKELDWDSQLKDIIGGYVKDGDVAVNLGSENALSDHTKEDKGLADMYPMVWAALVQTLRQGHTSFSKRRALCITDEEHSLLKSYHTTIRAMAAKARGA